MDKIGILGSGGQLGSDFHIAIPTAVPIFRSKLNYLTLTSQNQLDEVLGTSGDWAYLINCAALTDVDYCEDNPAEAMMVNSNAVKELSIYCEKYRIHFIHFSSDFVFDGISGYYEYNSIPNPINVYGKSKLSAEDFIREYMPSRNYTIIRTSSLFGVAKGKTNFIEKIINVGLKKEEVKANVNRIFVPTSTQLLSKKVFEKIQSENLPCEIVHSVCGSPASQFEISSFIFQNIPSLNHVKIIQTEKQDKKPLRPNNSSLISSPDWDLYDCKSPDWTLYAWKKEIQSYLLWKGYSRPPCVTEVEADAPYSVSKVWEKLGRKQPNYPELVEALRQDRTNFILGKKPKKGVKKSLAEFMNEVKL